MYQKFPLNLNEAQVKKLSEGSKVRVKNSQIGVGEDEYLLTNQQIAKLTKSKSMGKGCEISMSKSQLEHQMKKGNGRFTDFLKKGYQKVKEVVPKIVGAFKPQLEALGTKKAKELVAKVAEKVAPSVPQELMPFFLHGKDLANKYGQEQVKALLEGISQSGNGLLLAGAYSRGGKGLLNAGAYSQGGDI